MDLGSEALDSHAPSVLHLLPHHARHLHHCDSEQTPSCKSELLLINKLRQSLRSPTSSAHYQMWDGMERLINWPAVHCNH